MLDLPRNISPDEYTQAVLDSTVEGIWTIGLDGLIKTINKSAVRMFGYDSPEQMIGRNSHELVHYKHADGSHYPIVGCPIYLAFQEGKPVHLENEVLWKADGTPIYADYRSVPILKDGQILGAVVTFVDNTEKRIQQRHLIESRERYKILADVSLQIVWEATPDGQINFCNDFWFSYTGMTPRESLGEGWSQAIALSERIRVLSIWHSATLDHTPFEVELPIRRRDGVFRWHLAKGLPVYNELGEIKKWVGVATDIHLKKIESTRLQSTLDTIPVFIGLLNREGRILLINDISLKISGSSSEQEVGQLFWESSWWRNVDGMCERLKAAIADALEGKASRFDSPYPALIDNMIVERWVDFSMTPIIDEDGQVNEVTVTGFDITDRVLQATQLSLAIRDAERANSLKSSFLANMSHEIRTPLGAIMGFADLLKEQTLDVTTREQFLETISRNSKALTRIIDDILDLAKVESGKLDIETLDFSFKELVNDVIDLFRENVRAKGISIHAEIDPLVPVRISSDPTRLRQILINIVGNAVKFTNKGSVTVIARAVHDQDNRFLFSIFVKDTGVGLTHEQQQNLFQPFMQADNTTTRKFGGTGLGLALSRRLANALGGDVAITDSQIGKGSTFSITFEAGLGRQKTVLVPFGKLSELDRDLMPLADLRILIADDSQDNRFLITRILKKNGATVDQATNGLEAYRLAMGGQYDLVLMDIQMPEMDGYAASRNLREAGFKKPILALTAHAMAEERARSHAAGCNGHLTKPLSTPLLIQTIRSHASV